MPNSSNDLTLKVGFDIDKFAGELSKANGKLDSWAGSITKSITTLGKAFTGLSIAKFVVDVSKLAGEAEGVRDAFNKLPNSVKVMNDLKQATHGTVSELDLMKRAVMASNFDISLKALPQLLEFATLRAKQTGQSIDYLVDSIVTGIGRKSKLILDNLGISAVQLTEALGGASTASSTIGEVADAVGKIASKNLKQMGSLSENASTKMERLNASWINLKVAMGDAANGTGLFANALDGLTASMDLLSSRNLSFGDKMMAFLNPTTAMSIMLKDASEAARKLAEDQKLTESVTRQAGQAIATFGNNLKAIESAYKQNINYQKIMNEVNRLLIEDEKKKAEAIRNEKNLTEQLNSLRDDAILAVGKERVALNLQIQALEKEIAVLQKLGLEKEKQKRLFNFSGVRYKEEPNAPNSKKEVAKDILQLGKGVQAQFDMIDEKSKSIEEARKIFENLGISTQKGLAQSSEAFDKFLKDGDLDAYKNSLADIGSEQNRLYTGMARIGTEFGDAFGSVISGAQTFAQAISNMVVSVVSSLEKMAIGWMIANSFRFANPLLAIGAAAAGFGIVKGLFSKIGGSGGGSASLGNSVSSQVNKGYSQPKLVASVSGRDLNFVLSDQSRNDSRSSTTK